MNKSKAPTKATGMESGDGDKRKERVPDKERRREAGMSCFKHLLSRPRAVLATLLECFHVLPLKTHVLRIIIAHPKPGYGAHMLFYT